MFSRRKMNIVLLALAVAGSQAGAQNVDYVAQAKKKMSHVRDWSVQAAGKVRTKANNAYAVAREKALALYEKAKENKLMTAGMAYLALEASLWAFGKYTLFSRIFLLPGQLNAVNADLRAANADLNIANADLNIANADLNIVNANLNIANQNNMNLTGQLNNAHQNNVNLTGELNNANEDLNIANQNNVNLTGRLNNANANIVNLNQQIVDLEDGELRMMDDVAADLDRHTDHIDRLNQNNRQAQQQAQQLQAQLERQNELDMLTFGIVFKNVGEQIEQLNGRIDNKEAQINQLNHDNQQAQQFQQTLQQQHQEALEALRNEHHDALQARINELINVQAVVIQKLRAQHQQALISEQTQHGVMTEQRINELQRNHAQELRNLTNKHQQDVNDECTRLDNVHQQAQRDLEAQHKQDVTNEINRLTNEHQQAQQALQEQLEQAQKQAQKQAEELQSKLTIANQGILEYTASVELEVGETNDERETLQKEVERLNLEIDDLNIVIRERDVQIKQLNQDIADRAQTQERLLREDREESDRRAFEQGRAQAALNYEHGAILQVFNSLEYGLQAGQDPVGIIQNLMLQAPRLEFCSKLAAYTNQQATLSNTFNKLVTLTQSAIACVINQINGALVSLEKNVKTMQFAGITADNFDRNCAYIYPVIDNYFGQLNYAFGQLNTLVGFSANNGTIQSYLSNCDSDAILRSLYAMLTNSFEKIQRLGSWKNGNMVVNSHENAFNLYVHSKVANNAYQSYMQCWSMIPDPEDSLNVKEFKGALDAISTVIYNGEVRVQGPSNDVSSGLGNGSFLKPLKPLNHSVQGVSGFNLDQSAVNDFDLDAFFSNPIQSVVKIEKFNQSLIDRNRNGLGDSSIVPSSIMQSTNNMNSISCINLEDLQKLVFEGLEQDRNDFVSSNVGSSSMAQSVNNMSSKSCTNLDDLLKIELEKLEKSRNDFLSSNIEVSKSFVSSVAQSAYDGVNLEDITGLADSVLGFVSAVEKSSPFEQAIDTKSSMHLGSQLKNRAEHHRAIARGQLDEQQANYSYDNVHLPTLSPKERLVLADAQKIASCKPVQGNVITNRPVQNNNNNSSESNIVSDSLIVNFIKEAVKPNGDKVNGNGAVHNSPGDYSALLNQSGESIIADAVSPVPSTSTSDSIFAMEKALLERERDEQAEKDAKRIEQEKLNAAVSKGNDNNGSYDSWVERSLIFLRISKLNILLLIIHLLIVNQQLMTLLI